MITATSHCETCSISLRRWLARSVFFLGRRYARLLGEICEMKHVTIGICLLLFPVAAEATGLSVTAQVINQEVGAILEFSVENNGPNKDGLFWSTEPWRGGDALRMYIVRDAGEPLAARIRPVTGDGSCRWLYPGERLVGRLALADYFPRNQLGTGRLRWQYKTVSCNGEQVRASGE